MPRRKSFATALAVGAALASPVSSAAQGPQRDSVVGGGEDCLSFLVIEEPFGFCVHGLALEVDVSSGSAGQSPSGTVVFREHFGSSSTEVITEAVVTCLSV